MKTKDIFVINYLLKEKVIKVKEAEKLGEMITSGDPDEERGPYNNTG